MTLRKRKIKPTKSSFLINNSRNSRILSNILPICDQKRPKNLYFMPQFIHLRPKRTEKLIFYATHVLSIFDQKSYKSILKFHYTRLLELRSRVLLQMVPWSSCPDTASSNCTNNLQLNTWPADSLYLVICTQIPCHSMHKSSPISTISPTLWVIYYSILCHRHVFLTTLYAINCPILSPYLSYFESISIISKLLYKALKTTVKSSFEPL